MLMSSPYETSHDTIIKGIHTTPTHDTPTISQHMMTAPHFGGSRFVESDFLLKTKSLARYFYDPKSLSQVTLWRSPIGILANHSSRIESDFGESCLLFVSQPKSASLVYHTKRTDRQSGMR